MCIRAEYSSRGTKKSWLRAAVQACEKYVQRRRVRAPRSTKIRWNFNISRRRERAECNPLDKRVPPPWCLLTNRGHRFRAKLCRRGRAMSTRRKRVSQSLNESSRYVTHAKERAKEKEGMRFSRETERKRPSCWIVSKKFCHALFR